MEFEPKILGFLCNWCSYAGADLAGVSRIQYPPNLRVIRVMCSGRVDPVFVLDALMKGLDGVLVLGCHLGDCHYIDGNYEAESKYRALEMLLENINLNDRINLDWVSASEGMRFADLVDEFTEKIKSLGPSPISSSTKDLKLLDELQAIKRVFSNSRIRSLIGRERKITLLENTYGETIDFEKFNKILKDALDSEFYRSQIYLSLLKKSASVKDISQEINIDKTLVFKNLLMLRQRGLADVAGVDGLDPIYKAL
ncbi:MAG: hydrogenase iron-sulfur subunit [Candidatus Lokiarchaeota archaeon]|nr:hydrogenase iron-sulfur subunit [Candidatus Lokiarchaeota archaeon]